MTGKTADKGNNKWLTLVAEGKQAGRNKDLRTSADRFSLAYDASRAFASDDTRRGESAYYLAYARFLDHRNAEAIRLFEEALEHMLRDPSQLQRCCQIHSILASIHFGMKQLDPAERHVKESLTLERKVSRESWENIQLLGSILVTLRKYDEAVPILGKLIGYQKELFPQEVPKTMAILSFVHNKLGDVDSERRWQKEQLLVREQLRPSMPLPTIDIQTEPPAGWGKDRISHFIEVARRNDFASFENQKASYQELLKIDERFWNARRNLTFHLADVIATRPKQKFDQIQLEAEEWLELFFFMRAHASFLGAVRLALSAQCPETFALLRACLENAMYGFSMSGDVNLKKIWLDRHKNEEAKKLVRDTFTVGKMDRKIQAADDTIGVRVSQLYNSTLDEGAHPNAKAFFANTLQKNENGELVLALAYLNPGESTNVLNATIAVGQVALDVFGLVFPKLID